MTEEQKLDQNFFLSPSTVNAVEGDSNTIKTCILKPNINDNWFGIKEFLLALYQPKWVPTGTQFYPI